MPLTEFHANRNKPDGYQNECKDCRCEMQRKYYAKQREVNSSNAVLIQKGCIEELEKFTPRQLMQELKARGYMWTDMTFVQHVYYDKI